MHYAFPPRLATDNQQPATYSPVQPLLSLHHPAMLRALVEETRMMLMHLQPLAAIGYSLVWLLAGGGLGGAILIFIVAKLLGK